ncbi:phage holin family protein [Galactobacter valiniphilus]|uniref:phage holin family protein n=1 Tax=Galactobacter valiniphilus TaxID=2676122 RepID=UPI001F487E58|nr:phage holin family protein [Galactobacter valiniphilus]
MRYFKGVVRAESLEDPLIRTLLSMGTSLVLSAIALLLAGWLIEGVRLEPAGFVIAVVIFTVMQAIAAPIVTKLAQKYAQAIVGGVGLVSTLVALIVATLFPGGLHISGVASWIATPVLVWLVCAVGALLVEKFVLKGWWDRRAAAKKLA